MLRDNGQMKMSLLSYQGVYAYSGVSGRRNRNYPDIKPAVNDGLILYKSSV